MYYILYIVKYIYFIKCPRLLHILCQIIFQHVAMALANVSYFKEIVLGIEKHGEE